ncbi:poly-beta-1,6-N-acetyl-D-glucosamine biosynthesis protein PgaD [Fonsecaea erecta]|uniref:Poly-beta-1,6-N-acetyl-D-glucosamine biosynthesis protein PgaD n=1 Tax=Fonsecaea erecta TaxID=1367422 RepID=A0A178ZS00_9EURO|nr:poly-beta-1,6-N-acetyl-D-glucosamine biosynthesis protein PgaD [Fonsecaea erecta]OAP62156.1 poly-beta-1,6-N-acetyl-D-glucosamine biosynthesis protein PgaD [Fonsecaea erecta]
MTPSDSSDSSGGDLIYTPPGTESPLPLTSASTAPSKAPLRPSSPLRLNSLPPAIKDEFRADRQHIRGVHFSLNDEPIADRGDDDDDDDMDGRTSMHRPTGPESHEPLLGEDKKANTRGRLESPSLHGSSRPAASSRRSTFRSRSPSYAQPEDMVRRKYIYASFFLILSLISFVVQTETAVYIQHELKWDKAYCMMYLTHGSWIFLWPVQLMFLRIQKRKLTWTAFWRRHVYLLRSTAQMVRSQELHLSKSTILISPWPYMIKSTAFITTFLTMAGGSWYVAVNLTSPSDLTAIYNCSAFFAYVFSIMLLNDKLRFDKALSVALAIIGVLVVAYGDKDDTTPGPGTSNPGAEKGFGTKLVGNIIIGIGSVAYGFYEVLYKRFACPPEGTSPGRGMIFANTFGSMVGFFTLTVLWIPLPILHWTGLETFEIPSGQAARLLAVSTLSNAVFSGSFLVLMSLTSPVLSSVAALLTIFLVGITDWIITGKPLSAAALSGCGLIIVAFVMLSWATYREMREEQLKREAEEENKVFDDDDDEDEEGDDEPMSSNRRRVS